MGTIRNFIQQYIEYVHAALRDPGMAAFLSVFGVSFADAVIPIPGGMDGLVATAVLSADGNPLNIAAYVLMASVGNTLGNIIVYGIGYKGGEVFLEKRLGKGKFASMRSRFEKREVLTLMLAAMMPPPFPFKTLVFSAAVFEVNFRRFLLGIFIGRIFRFSILSALVLTFGPQIIGIIRDLIRQHLLGLVLGLLAIVLVLILVLQSQKQRRKKSFAAKENTDLPGSRPV